MTSDSSVRMRLLEAAAQVMADQGPEAVSTRKVALAAGTSTMGVYTHFGSIRELVRGVVDEGFARLAARFAAVPRTGDPRRDLTAMSLAYVDHARDNASLYRVMFGAAALGSFRPTSPEELATGRRETLDVMVDAVRQAVPAPRHEDVNAWHLANQWWSAMHGYVMLEAAGYFEPDRGRDKVLLPLLDSIFASVDRVSS